MTPETTPGATPGTDAGAGGLAAPPEEFTLTRRLDAPRDLVFRAWTDPAQLTHWWGPRGFTAPQAGIAVDLRPGGRWRTETIAPDGTRYPMAGTYREIRAPERLVFTWGVAEVGEPVRETAVITVELAELPDGRTEMTFRQAGRHSPQERASMLDGWTTCLDRLGERELR
jgi:uncharacterized protein YndB with AHSA1/START domain